jgi:hypothetical protein
MKHSLGTPHRKSKAAIRERSAFRKADNRAMLGDCTRGDFHTANIHCPDDRQCFGPSLAGYCGCASFRGFLCA